MTTSRGATGSPTADRDLTALAGTERHQLAEGPQWWPDSTLTWVDIPAGTLTVARPEGTDANIESVHHVGGELGTAVRCVSGGFLIAVDQTLAHLDDGGTIRHLVTIESGRTRLNDGKCDPAGRFWVGSMSASPGEASLYRVDLDGTISRALTGLSISNGIGWSPARTTMYLADSTPATIDAFDYDVTSGAISNRRTLVKLPAGVGVPDGLTVDHDGFLWVALWDGGEVRRYDPAGRLVTTVSVPAVRPTACCFGGPDGNTLWITTASQGLTPDQQTPETGLLLGHRTSVGGPPAQAFGGTLPTRTEPILMRRSGPRHADTPA